MLKTSAYLLLVFSAATIVVAAMMTVPWITDREQKLDMREDLRLAAVAVQSAYEIGKLENERSIQLAAAQPELIAGLSPTSAEEDEPRDPRSTGDQDEPTEPTPEPDDLIAEALDRLPEAPLDLALVTDNEGRVRLARNDAIPKDDNIADIAVVAEALKGKTGSGIWLRKADAAVFSISATPVLNSGGQILGALVVADRLDSSFAQRIDDGLAHSERTGHELELSLVYNGKQVATSVGEATMLVAADEASSSLTADYVKKLEEPAYVDHVTDDDGPAMVSMATQLGDGPGEEQVALLVVVGRPRGDTNTAEVMVATVQEGEVLKNPEVLTRISIVAVAGVVAFLFTILLMSVEHSSPGRRFRRQIKKLAADPDKFPLNPKKFHGSFRKGVAQLRDVIDELRKASIPQDRSLLSKGIPKLQDEPLSRSSDAGAVAVRSLSGRPAPVIIETRSDSRSGEATTESAPFGPSGTIANAEATTENERFGDGLPDAQTTPMPANPGPPTQPEEELVGAAQEFDPGPTPAPAAWDSVGDAATPLGPKTASMDAAPTDNPRVSSRSEMLTAPNPSLSGANAAFDPDDGPEATERAAAVPPSRPYGVAGSIDITAQDDDDATISMRDSQQQNAMQQPVVESKPSGANPQLGRYPSQDPTRNMGEDRLAGIFADDQGQSQTRRLLEKLRSRNQLAGTPEDKETMQLKSGIIEQMVGAVGEVDDDPTTVVGDSSSPEMKSTQRNLTPKSLLGALKQRAAVPPSRTPTGAPASGSPLEPTHVKPHLQAAEGDSELNEYRALFEQFVETKRECGESTDGLTMDRFIRRLQRNREKLIQQYKCRAVRFKVYVKQGKAALKATPLK